MVEIWVDSISLQSFTKDQWRAHQAESISKVRKKTVRFRAVDNHGKFLTGAKISLQQIRPGFPFGSAIGEQIINNTAYQSWFASRFTVTTFENEMKWYDIEYAEGKEDYSKADGMIAFAKSHRIAVRGHNIFWDDPKYQLQWVWQLNNQQLWNATTRRLKSVMSRYGSQVIAWDVVNENLHFSFFESKLGGDASSIFYKEAQQLDSNTLLFLNDYNTLEEPGDTTATPAKYLQKLKQIQWYCGNGAKMAIGLEGHFETPNIPYLRSALNALAGAKVPIWLTEVDLAKDPNQAQYLEEILREAYAHPAVLGIVMWAGWHPEGCDRMCLTDNKFKNLPTGDVVDKLIAEWKTRPVEGTTTSDGYFETQLFHGDYEITVSHTSADFSLVQSLKVDSGSQFDYIIQVRS